MNKIVLPFRLNDVWLGIELDYVKSVDACGKISLMPNSSLPVVGLMQKNGKIFPVWSLYSLAQGTSRDIKNCIFYIELQVDNKQIVLPVNEIVSVTEISLGWIPVLRYGLKLYKYLDKKAPPVFKDVDEFDIQENQSNFEQEAIHANMHVEEIL